MSLITQLGHAFDSSIRRRGAEYFVKGRVQVEASSALLTTATVNGTRRYRVVLEREGRRIYASCNCPYFDVDLCKHIWATVLAVAGQPMLQERGLELLHKGVGADDFADDEAERRKVPAWRSQLSRLKAQISSDPASPDAWPGTRELLYVIDATNAARNRSSLGLELLCRDRKADGSWGKPMPRTLRREWLRQLPDNGDRHILAVLAGAIPAQGLTLDAYPAPLVHGPAYPSRYLLTELQPRLLLPLLCRTGRCLLRIAAPAAEPVLAEPLAWQSGDPWQFRLTVQRAHDGDHYRLNGQLWRGDECMELTAPLLLLDGGILITAEWAAQFESHGSSGWITLLRSQGALRVPAAQCDEFLTELLRQPMLPPLDLPEELRHEEVLTTPRPRLVVRTDRAGFRDGLLYGELSFDYGGSVLSAGQADRGVVLATQRRLLLRDHAAENAAELTLRSLGWRPQTSLDGTTPRRFELAARHLPAVVTTLVSAGWHVEAEGKVYRAAGPFALQISSGVDWFELQGDMQFGDLSANLPELLAALRRGEHRVRLGDGSFGVLPEDWLRQYGLLASLGKAQGDQVRFARGQAALLDALLSARPEVHCDESFLQLRAELQHFAGLQALEPPPGFRGELRHYQKESLGWFAFLRRCGFGGCLADDMGLGKTVQVLALLESRRSADSAAPSLVVVPKSLIFNWKQEAARFAPQLRVLDHTGNQRATNLRRFAAHDLVLTTYGVLRNDAAALSRTRFDYVILDEAQAIKNAASVSAKAARLLQGEHRLALSGTPIENHLGELWSLFEFLNPGMLGTAALFHLSGGAARSPDAATRELLSQALRPFLLRRTKEQVARELPARVEQTLICDLGSRQRKLYDQLRNHYRVSLLRRVQTSGIGTAKIQILEALLRLRQAAIHPGLLDMERRSESSAKLDLLLPRLLEIVGEGHKALVFSQFTGMLSILRQHLDREGIVYEYLDGKTRNRQACVERFQQSADCRLFLISLKAGGVGLNLTAAQYVFLLDPWWNPAVEAQAIDRTHRIGQTRQVFACRLIARDTVEERVLELQQSKRDLADAIIGAKDGLIRTLSREDLELLLS